MKTTTSVVDRIGVGIDTARYGHRVWFLRPDRQAAATPLTVLENKEGYQKLQQCLEQLHRQHPGAHFHIHIDAAGQYAANLEHFVRSLDLPCTVSIGEPKRNKDYRKAHFPKSNNDDTEAQALARFAVVEQPGASAAVPPAFADLREIASRLQAQVKQRTRAINRLHNLMARVFPELATLANDFSSRWVLHLVQRYPTAQDIGRAHRHSLEQIPHLPSKVVERLHQAAKNSIGSLRGDVARTLVRNLVAEVRQGRKHENALRKVLSDTYEQLPAGGHQHLSSISGIGAATAAVLTAKIMDIDRFATPAKLISYFGVFPEEDSSGVDKHGRPLPTGTPRMSRKGNDLVRSYLWNAARVAMQHNPAVRALYRRLRAKGTRGDVALGHAMGKLLHLVFAVWKTNRPFDPTHFPWEAENESKPVADVDTTTSTRENTTTIAAKEEAVGHTQVEAAQKVVTTDSAKVEAAAPSDKPISDPAATSTRPRVDFAFLRQQITMEPVLCHLGLRTELRGRVPQLRGRCPVHSPPGAKERNFSVHLGKNIFQCLHADCAVHGNVLDLWAAVHQLALYDAALHLAATFGLARNREEATVKGTVSDV